MERQQPVQRVGIQGTLGDGSPQAIAAFARAVLGDGSVTVKAAFKGSCLYLLLENDPVPVATEMTVFAEGLVEQLLGAGVEPEQLQQVKVGGQRRGDRVPVWCHQFFVPVPELEEELQEEPQEEMDLVSLMDEAAEAAEAIENEAIENSEVHRGLEPIDEDEGEEGTIAPGGGGELESVAESEGGEEGIEEEIEEEGIEAEAGLQDATAEVVEGGDELVEGGNVVDEGDVDGAIAEEIPMEEGKSVGAEEVEDAAEGEVEASVEEVEEIAEEVTEEEVGEEEVEVPALVELDDLRVALQSIAGLASQIDKIEQTVAALAVPPATAVVDVEEEALEMDMEGGEEDDEGGELGVVAAIEGEGVVEEVDGEDALEDAPKGVEAVEEESEIAEEPEVVEDVGEIEVGEEVEIVEEVAEEPVVEEAVAVEGAITEDAVEEAEVVKEAEGDGAIAEDAVEEVVEEEDAEVEQPEVVETVEDEPEEVEVVDKAAAEPEAEAGPVVSARDKAMDSIAALTQLVASGREDVDVNATLAIISRLSSVLDVEQSPESPVVEGAIAGEGEDEVGEEVVEVGDAVEIDPVVEEIVPEAEVAGEDLVAEELIVEEEAEEEELVVEDIGELEGVEEEAPAVEEVEEEAITLDVPLGEAEEVVEEAEAEAEELEVKGAVEPEPDGGEEPVVEVEAAEDVPGEEGLPDVELMEAEAGEPDVGEPDNTETVAIAAEVSQLAADMRAIAENQSTLAEMLAQTQALLSTVAAGGMPAIAALDGEEESVEVGDVALDERGAEDEVAVEESDGEAVLDVEPELDESELDEPGVEGSEISEPVEEAVVAEAIAVSGALEVDPELDVFPESALPDSALEEPIGIEEESVAELEAGLEDAPEIALDLESEPELEPAMEPEDGAEEVALEEVPEEIGAEEVVPGDGAPEPAVVDTTAIATEVAQIAADLFRQSIAQERVALSEMLAEAKAILAPSVVEEPEIEELKIEEAIAVPETEEESAPEEITPESALGESDEGALGGTGAAVDAAVDAAAEMDLLGIEIELPEEAGEPVADEESELEIEPVDLGPELSEPQLEMPEPELLEPELPEPALSLDPGEGEVAPEVAPELDKPVVVPQDGDGLLDLDDLNLSALVQEIALEEGGAATEGEGEDDLGDELDLDADALAAIANLADMAIASEVTDLADEFDSGLSVVPAVESPPVPPPGVAVPIVPPELGSDSETDTGSDTDSETATRALVSEGGSGAIANGSTNGALQEGSGLDGLDGWLEQGVGQTEEPQALSVTQASQGQRFLRFHLGFEDTALLPLDQVREVLRVPVADILPVPHVPESVLGIHNWRGEMLWMVDLNHLVGFAPLGPSLIPQDNPLSTAVVLEVEGQNLGLLVSQIEDIEWHESPTLQPPSAGLFPDRLLPFVSGYLTEASSMVLSAEAIAAAQALQVPL